MAIKAALGFSALVAALLAAHASAADPLRIYVGTYTSGSDSRGIYRFELDPATGQLAPVGEPTPSVEPSFLALHPGGRFLYAANEVGDAPEDEGGAVSAFAIDPASGALRFLNRQPSGGASPCHLSVTPDGRHVLVANYHGGSVAVLPIAPDGRLGPASARVQHEGSSVHERQTRPHAHWIDVDPSGRFVLAADLGTDEVVSYRLDDETGRLTRYEAGTARLQPGAGPRHVAFHPGGRRAYVVNELDSTVSAFSWDPEAGRFEPLRTVSTLPDGYAGQSTTAEIAIRPDGRFLYVSNRGHDSIAIFAIDAETGEPTPAGHVPTRGKKPRNFAIDPSGRFLLSANQDSDSLAVFRISEADGGLEPLGEPVPVPRPVCVLFEPAR